MAEAPAQPRTTPPVTAPVVSGGARESGPLPTARSRRRYRVVLVGLLVLAVTLPPWPGAVFTGAAAVVAEVARLRDAPVTAAELAAAKQKEAERQARRRHDLVGPRPARHLRQRRADSIGLSGRGFGNREDWKSVV